MLRSTPEVKQLNHELIRQQIVAHDTCTKSEVSRWTSLSVSTCNTILNEMEGDGEIIHVSQEDGNVGRPASRYKYNPDYLHVLVLYVLSEEGQDSLVLAVANALGEVLWRDHRQPDAITYQVIEDVIAERLSADRLVQGIAFGIPGVSHAGVVERCDVASLDGVDVEGLVRARFGITPELRNDMDFIANGVYNTIPNGGGNLATLLFPTNGCVGCGFIVDGKALSGNSRFAGEISYIAEGLGVSRIMQEHALLDRGKFRDLAGKMVMIACGTIDPEVVMLMGNRVGDDDLAVIRKFCEAIVSERHLPRLLVDNNVDRYYIKGMIRVMLDRLQYQLLN